MKVLSKGLRAERRRAWIHPLDSNLEGCALQPPRLQPPAFISPSTSLQPTMHLYEGFMHYDFLAPLTSPLTYDSDSDPET
mmetsp:Transcript_31116/g.81663  ORF Transcript_31116/g.81663 Transcript_31116/m.81663 type:complete len:80 (-) Transcript_31116:56-295(-)